jgi:hypothetical protein
MCFFVPNLYKTSTLSKCRPKVISIKAFILYSLFLNALTSSIYAQPNNESTRQLFPIHQNGKSGYIDNTGRIVIRPQFDEAWGFSEGLAPFRDGNKWGYIDETGRIVIRPQFFEATSFKEGLAPVGAFFKSGFIDQRLGNYGYINKVGGFAIKPQFEVAFEFSDGLAAVLLDGKNSYIDKSGKIVFSERDLFVEEFSDGLALFTTRGSMPDSKTGFLDKTGMVAISPRFDFGQSFSEGLACMSLNKKAGFIDQNGHVVIDFRFDGCRSFSEGMAAVLVGDKWGYIDKSGNIVIEPNFPEAEDFSDGVAVIRVVEPGDRKEIKGNDLLIYRTGKYGVIDRSGRMILQPKFIQISSFSDGLAWVNLSGSYIVHGNVDKWAYINKSGRYVWKSFASSRRRSRNSSLNPLKLSLRMFAFGVVQQHAAAG